MRIAAHRGLYNPDDPVPILAGTRCDACGSVYFPPLGIGCQVCGAAGDRLVAAPLAAAGVLHSVATVHRHDSSDFDGPYGVCEVQLDDGPLIRATLSEILELDAIGLRVEARWVVARTDGDGHEVVEPRFALVAYATRAGGDS